MPFPLIWTRLLGFGRRAEIRGCEYLRSQGYRMLASPYRTASGEVDIVAEEDACLVFVEVKARRRDPHPEDSVTYTKRRRIVRAADAYRRRHGMLDWPYRFDILAIVLPDEGDPHYRLIKDAFRAEEH